MKRRERILTTIDHREPDRVPIGFDIDGRQKERLLAYYGAKDLDGLYHKVGIDSFSVWTWPAVLLGTDWLSMAASTRCESWCRERRRWWPRR